MYYYVKNQSGGVSTVNEDLYNRLKDKDGYECWTEDPYENLPKEVQKVSYPKHTGGGWYELSDGSKVQGKDKAIQAQKELD